MPAAPAVWKAVLPSLRRPGEHFRLSLKAEDSFGNPSDQVDAEIRIQASVTVNGPPETCRFLTLPGYEWSGNTAVGGDRIHIDLSVRGDSGLTRFEQDPQVYDSRSTSVRSLKIVFRPGPALFTCSNNST